MKIFFEYEQIEFDTKGTAVALGTFDGLHIGHMEVINTMKNIAKERDLKSFVYTFSNHPKTLTTPERAPVKIMEIDEKVQLFTQMSLDYLAIVKFDHFHLHMPARQFVEDILVKKLNMKHLVVGYDYRFGLKAEGDVQMLIEYGKKLGYVCEVIPPIMKNEIRVSSTMIRKLLEQGRVEEANFYLGRYHFIRGEVIRGKGKGRELGYPTANLQVGEHVGLISPGVYITETTVEGKTYKSATNVGCNPTFENSGLHVETFLWGFEGDLYGKNIEVAFRKRLRREMKFSHLKELIEAIHEDIKEMKRFFNIEEG